MVLFHNFSVLFGVYACAYGEGAKEYDGFVLNTHHGKDNLYK